MIENKPELCGDCGNNAGQKESRVSKLSLTKLWEIIVRTKSIPDGVTESLLYESVAEKLRAPEREVRQHALRVLEDIIPATQPTLLDARMRDLLPDILPILGYSSPSLRKSALDAVKIYLHYSANYGQLMKELLETSENFVTAAPFLIDEGSDERVVKLVVEELWRVLESSDSNQEDAAKALARLRFNLGDDHFKRLITPDQYQHLQDICESYNLPIDYTDDITEDKVILETEITLRSGPAITMKIHEETTTSSFTDHNYGVIKVLDDESESEYEELARRTPRKVRFGGESVKLRTPESDSSNNDDKNNTLSVIVDDAVAITTKKSLIPVRIASLPTTPIRSSRKVTSKRLCRSEPDLARSYAKTRLPLRKDSSLVRKIKVEVGRGELGQPSKTSTKPQQKLTVPKPPPSKLNSPNSPRSLSPIPPHKEIELFHNLTRSPLKQRRNSAAKITDNDDIKDAKDTKNTNNFSFLLCTSNKTEDISNNNKSGFKLIEDDDNNNVEDNRGVLALPAPATVSSVCASASDFTPAPNSVTVSSSNFDPAPDDVRNYAPSANKGSNEAPDDVRNVASADNVDNNNEVIDNCDEGIRNSNEMRALEYKVGVDTNSSNSKYDSFKVCPESGLKEDYVNKNGFDLNQDWNISSFSSNETLGNNKSEDLDTLIKMLKQPNTCETLEPGPAALLFEALFACQHSDKLHFLADDALIQMVEGVRPQVLDQCMGRLCIGFCKTGAPSGVNLALLIMKKCPPKRVINEIVSRCFGHRTREGALQVLMSAARLLPRNELLVGKMIEFAAATLRDRRRKVRHAALETLASLAQLSSNSEVLDAVDDVVKVSPDHQYLIRVVRSRLSRRQLPTVELDGTVRYSTPRDQTELEWLSGRSNSDTQSVSSSASSSGNSVNYWRHNSRHEENEESIIKDDNGNGKQQIWAIDPVVFHKNGHHRDSNKGNSNPSSELRPVYILQPETLTDPVRGGCTYRRYERGRSFSPPKLPPRQPPQCPQYVAASSAHPPVTALRHLKYKEGVRKSFSSEQLFTKEREHHEAYSFSLSSRSSTTSTGSSTKSNNWHREMRSGIPVPISSDTKFRLRTNNSNNSNTGPIVARRSALGSVLTTPVLTRASPRETPDKTSITTTHPPRSSGSESSGYFTPPPDTKKSFVKLDSSEKTSESEEKDALNDNNNNNNNENSNNNNETIEELDESTKQSERNSSATSTSTNNDNDNDKEEIVNTEVIERRFTISKSNQSLYDKPIQEYRTKSKSVVDLQSFLPEIPNRKNINSAPILKEDLHGSRFKDDLHGSRDLIITTTEQIHAVIPILNTTESPAKEITITRKLSRRLSRTQSRKSIRSTPRDPTPSSSRVSTKSKDTLQAALNQMNNSEWEVMIQGLQTLTRLAKYYPEVIEGQIHTVCVNLGKHIKNLRSQVARAACHTASEIFGSCRRSLDIELEEIAGPLLHRTADTNKFLRCDANAALDAMCEHLPVSRVVGVITGRGCNHQNGIVRSAAIRLLTDLVKRYRAEKIFQMNKEVKDKILIAGANGLADGSLEARNYAKEMFSYLIGHPQFHKSLLDVVPQNTLRHISKTLNSIKPNVDT